jgi:bifunctional non-homologous end joining protein LigD
LRSRKQLPPRVRAAIKLHPARLYVFDTLAAGELDLRLLPLSQRKEILRESFENTPVLSTPSAS